MKILIVEDEPNAAHRLKKYIQEIKPTASFLGVLESIEGAVEWFQNNGAPDLVFMDIHLSDGNCFEIFEQVEVDTPIVFATAYDDYALRAFSQQSIAYVLKPLKKADLEKAFEKLEKFRGSDNLEPQELSSDLVSKDSISRFLVKVGAKINLIKLNEIAYFYSKDKITFAMTNLGRRFPIGRSLENLANELPPDFFRINRKFIIRMDSIESMRSHTKGRVVIELTPPIDIESIVSTDRSPRFKKWLKGEKY